MIYLTIINNNDPMCIFSVSCHSGTIWPAGEKVAVRNMDDSFVQEDLNNPFQNVRLVECSSTSSGTRSTGNLGSLNNDSSSQLLNPFGHIRGALALGSVNGRLPSTKPEKNKSVGAIGGLVSPKSPKIIAR